MTNGCVMYKIELDILSYLYNITCVCVCVCVCGEVLHNTNALVFGSLQSYLGLQKVVVCKCFGFLRIKNFVIDKDSKVFVP